MWHAQPRITYIIIKHISQVILLHASAQVYGPRVKTPHRHRYMKRDPRGAPAARRGILM